MVDVIKINNRVECSNCKSILEYWATDIMVPKMAKPYINCPACDDAVEVKVPEKWNWIYPDDY